MRESRQFAGSDRKTKFEETIVAPHANQWRIALCTLFTENIVRFCNEDAFTEYHTG